jgi:hypothetical protein
MPIIATLGKHRHVTRKRGCPNHATLNPGGDRNDGASSMPPKPLPMPPP